MRLAERSKAGPARPAPRARWRMAAALVALAVVGIAGAALAGVQWGQVVDYRSPYLFEVPPGTETPPLTDRVVLVVVDGLRVDTSRRLPVFRRLGAEGSFLTARTAQPSLSLPGWAQLATGAPPEVSGVTTNWYEGAVAIDSLFDAARRAGMRTGLAGHEAWGPLFGDRVDRGAYGASDDARSDAGVGAQAGELLGQIDRGFLVVHLPDVDNVGHYRGVGAAYEEAARGADAVIARVVAAAGPGTTFLLTSDHGHIERGGHGGAEPEVVLTPLVLWGPGIRSAGPAEVSQADVAPTVAALLGLSRPTHATGRVIEEVLDADPQTVEAIRRAHGAAASAFFSRAAGVIGREASDAATFEAARRAEARGELLWRLPLALLLLGGVAALLVRLTRGADPVAVLAGAAVFAATWSALFFGRGLTFSLSYFNTEDQIRPYLLMRLLDAVIAALLAGTAAGVVAAMRRRGRPFPTSVAAAAWAVAGLAVPVAAFLAVYGWGFEWRLPEFRFAFAQYLVLLAMAGVGLTAGLSGAAGAAAGKVVPLFRRPRPG